MQLISYIQINEPIFFIKLQELNKHIENGLGKNLADRCSSEVNQAMHQSQQEMIGKMGEEECSGFLFKGRQLKKTCFWKNFLSDGDLMLTLENDKGKAILDQDWVCVQLSSPALILMRGEKNNEAG